MRRYGLAFWFLVIVALALCHTPARAATRESHPAGAFVLTLRFSHLDPALKLGNVYANVLDRIVVEDDFDGWDACHAAGLEDQARFQDPPRNAYVDFTCAYKGYR